MEDKLILLVEDNPHIMAINDAALHMRGYRTLQAETAHKCRELLCFHAVRRRRLRRGGAALQRA